MSTAQHTYPSQYQPGSGSIENMTAWVILDTLPPGTLTLEQRAHLAGLITGSLLKAVEKRMFAAEMGALRRIIAAINEAMVEGSPMHQRIQETREAVKDMRKKHGRKAVRS